MISGARELLTPGAWKKVGWTYELNSDSHRDIAPQAEHRLTNNQQELRESRRRKLEMLKDRLWAYAATHGGAFPSDWNASGLLPDQWLQPGTWPMDWSLAVESVTNPPCSSTNIKSMEGIAGSR